MVLVLINLVEKVQVVSEKSNIDVIEIRENDFQIIFLLGTEKDRVVNFNVENKPKIKHLYTLGMSS